MSALRLLAISNLYPPQVLGGYELLCAQVMERVGAQGHQVTVLTSTAAGTAETEERQGVRVLRRLELAPPFDRPPVRSRRYALHMGAANRRIVAEAIASLRPDAVILWSQLRLTAGPARAAASSGVPTVWVLNDLNWLSLAPRAFSVRPTGLARWVLDRTVHRRATLAGLCPTRATAISRLVRDQLAAGGLAVTRAAVIHQGIAVDDFPPRPDPGGLATPPRLLYVGALLEQKGVQTLAEAVRRLHIDGLRLDLTFAGDGDAAIIADLRRRLDGVPGVRWLGRVARTAIAAVYREHDLLAFPSLYREGFGLTFLEAMASGLPVVASDTGGHVECLEDGGNSLIFPAGDAPALAARLRRLLADEPLRRRLAEAGRAMVASRFTIERYADDLQALFADAAQAGRAARTATTSG